MKVVILCGGKGLRMKGEDDLPKPLQKVGDKPILWHIMKTYMYYGLDEFILLLGYEGEKIKEYFMNDYWKNNNFVLDRRENKIHIMEEYEKWKITFVDTGKETMTGGRIKQIESLIDDETFMLTYGDGLSDIHIKNLLDFHNKHKKIATLAGIQKNSSYGQLTVKNHIAKSFEEKPSTGEIINGGFFVLNKKIFEYISDEKNCIFEQEPLINLTKDGQLAVYPHKGFWIGIDTYKELVLVNEMCSQKKAPWEVWKNEESLEK
ncbi:sugar phosphate nucleotidyltransferase [Inediibacterium massiliense]|uniref:sugar phosphate nucleotidyltransferase n=1 Tax=Inediibacterium massiliense TaxID=1658111 RepID=UPI0006B57EF3|nr:sugar phosphate nucleotidyltransferase [Inediibacterium massiliense]